MQANREEPCTVSCDFSWSNGSGESGFSLPTFQIEPRAFNREGVGLTKSWNYSRLGLIILVVIIHVLVLSNLPKPKLFAIKSNIQAPISAYLVTASSKEEYKIEPAETISEGPPRTNQLVGNHPLKEEGKNRNQSVSENTQDIKHKHPLPIKKWPQKKQSIGIPSDEILRKPDSFIQSQPQLPKLLEVSPNLVGSLFLKRQQQQAIALLAQQSARQQLSKKGLSEMNGEMDLLNGGSHFDITKQKTLDNVMDPNRIVRVGDNCYRVVNNGDLLNPYDESLGALLIKSFARTELSQGFRLLYEIVWRTGIPSLMTLFSALTPANASPTCPL